MKAAPASGVRRALETGLAGHGLILRGWLIPDVALAPRLASGEPASLIALVGHGGSGFWPIFEAWHRDRGDIADPLDNWSKAVIAPVADAAGGEAVFPSDRPWHPFQQWAMAAEGLKPSPLGMLIHPVYGLWHGYRGAILFGDAALVRPGTGDIADDDVVPAMASNHPCDSCVGKPCLSTCPVGAFGVEGFNVPICREYLKTDAGRQECMSVGCAARDACPVGREHRYSDRQIRFHMAAFG